MDRVRRREKESKQRRKEERQKRRGWLSKARIRRWRGGRRGGGSYVIHAREGTDLRLDPRRSSRFTCRRFRSSTSSLSFLRFSSVSLDVERYGAKLNYADGRELQRYTRYRESTRSDHIVYVVRFLFFFSGVQVHIHVYVESKCGSKSQFLSSVRFVRFYISKCRDEWSNVQIYFAVPIYLSIDVGNNSVERCCNKLYKQLCTNDKLLYLCHNVYQLLNPMTLYIIAIIFN